MNVVKTQRNQGAEDPAAGREISGKLVIVTVLFVAVAGALFSWFFRYNATHRAAEFWGPSVCQSVRDSASIQMYTPSTPIKRPKEQAAGTGGYFDDAELRDISAARGLVHLRNALLEDRSFEWPAQKMSPDVQWTHGLVFGKFGDANMTLLLFSRDFNLVTELGGDQMLSCAPIANGMREMFEEFAAMPASGSKTASR